MEGLSYHKNQDSSTRNDQMDSESTQNDGISNAIKNKTAKFKTPARNNSINQTPKLIGLSKLVNLMVK